MYSDKKNILQLVALLKAHGVRKIVLCPGSRNAAIVHTLANIEDFTCYSVTDERSAGFFAIGLSLQGGGPAAVCCTSGSALLNLHPAVAEAFYQQVPLIVISADRPAAWIGQMDGQTLPQPHVFGTLVKMSVNLPEVHTEEDEWFCNRLINEAILETTHHGKGPVHINVPISEPIYRFTAKTLPEVRVITRYQGLSVYDRDYKELIERLNKYNKRMVVVGQMNLIYLFEKKYVKPLYKHFAWLTEHLGNQTIPGIPIKNFDAAVYSMTPERQEDMAPEILITYGGHIVSKQLKKYLRNHPPREHWHVAADGKIADLYGCLTTVIEMDPFEFLEKIAFLPDHIGDLLQELHPTPAVCGLPKEEAFRFIPDNEGYDRSYYSGFTGWLDTEGHTDIYVNLRCMEIKPGEAILYAGGGILASSEVESEWMETGDKMNTMRSILHPDFISK
jgi:2-succinyl-5-enolpyruvyl-6-hydroxy-3-cyclohexene-1-carboxylate synthase